ncbi:hypothetical protein BC938DRAFT_470653 [Jimgerdemannia flammicorona]|uniref:Uncharacterized protein n=1 Tax=Jimgerdemannia flammicorona TaxID=994334 RepID=A0A433Q9X3_9FUNG|nr:hypothetical protein BC938DRAFT_470653 [Jimgerdemannia flammicorona]
MGTRRSSVLGCTIVSPLSYYGSIFPLSESIHLPRCYPVSAIAWGIVYGHGFLGIVKMMFFMVFIDFVLVHLEPFPNAYIQHTFHGSIRRVGVCVRRSLQFFLPSFPRPLRRPVFFHALAHQPQLGRVIRGQLNVSICCLLLLVHHVLGSTISPPHGTFSLPRSYPVCSVHSIPIRVQREQPCAAIVFWQLDRTSGNRVVSVIVRDIHIPWNLSHVRRHPRPQNNTDHPQQRRRRHLP